MRKTDQHHGLDDIDDFARFDDHHGGP